MKAKPIRGTGFGGAVRYCLEIGKGPSSKRPEIVGGNMSGRNEAELVREFAAVRRLRPDVDRPVWHCPVSLTEGETASPERWDAITKALMVKLEFNPDNFPFTVIRHGGKCQHGHLVASRIGWDGSLWLGKWEAFKVIQACQELEREFGLVLTPGLHGDDDAEAKAARPDRKADSQAVINANRSKGQRRIDTGENARALLDCAARSSELPTFTRAAHLVGFTVKPNRSETTGRISGLSVIPPGRKKFLALGEATNKKLTWLKLLKIFDQNEQAADAARAAARVVVDAADRHAAERVAVRLDKQPESVPHPARALSPAAIHEAKEPTMTNDKLDFLNVPPPRPHGVPLDDAGLAMSMTAVVRGDCQKLDDAGVDEPPEDDSPSEIDPLLPDRSISRPT